MARINTYSTDTTVQNNDKLLGSNTDGTTRNFSVEDISAFQANTNSAAIIGQLPYIYHNNSFGGNSSRQAGSITINTTDTTTAFSSVTTLKFSKTPNGYTSDVVAVLTAFLNKDIIISSNDDPNNFATYKCTAVTQDSSETDFYDLSLTYIAGNGNLEVGKFYSTSRDISTSENTTYDISIPSGTTSLRLTGSDASADDIVISGSGGVTVSRTSANILDISSTPEQYNGTVTSVSGAGTVSGLTLSGTVTSSGSLTLGGSLVLTSSQITTGLGFTPYNATNPSGYTSFAEPGIFSGSGSPTLASGVTAAEIRNLIGAGTSSLVLGTSSSTALAGDTVTISGSQASAILANTLKVSDTGVPAILSDESSPSLNTGITAAEVRTLIGAGTSSTSGTVTSVSGTGTISGLTLSGTVTSSGSLTLGGSLVLTSLQITNGLGYTPYDDANPDGFTSFAEPGIFSGGGTPTLAAGVSAAEIRTLIGAGTSSTSGTVTSVNGTGTVSGLTLSGAVTSSGSLTLGGTLTLTSSDITTGLGYTPYNATNPDGYTTNTGTVTGTGTTNYISKFTSSSAIGDSIVFDNGTNVGIGTASPSEKLHVEGIIQVDTGVANRNAQLRDDGLYISRTSDGSRILQIRAASNDNSMDIKARTSINFLLNGAEKVSINQSGVALEVTGEGSFSGFVRSNFLNNYANSRSIIGAPSNYVSIYDGSGVEAVRVDSSGNVGIGTTSPLSKLQVVGTSTSGLIRLTDTSGVARIASSNEAGSAWEDLELKADNILLTPQGGNVGIGTASPLAKTHIKGSNSGATAVANGTLIIEQGSAPSIQILSANSQTQSIKFGDPQDGDAGRITYAHPTDDMKFFTGGGERMVVDSSGNLGIGTTSPGAKLDIVGNGASSATTALLVENSSGTDLLTVRDDGRVSLLATGFLYFGTTQALAFNAGNELRYGYDASIQKHTFHTNGGTAQLHITNDNKVGIGTTSPTAKLNIVGNGTTSATTALLVENSATTELFRVRDDGSVYGTGGSGVDTNAAYGKDALISNAAGTFNTAVGTNSLQNNTASYNTALGAYALNTNTTGANNVAVGINSLRLNVSGSTNTAVGRESLYSNTASENTAVGYQALYNNTTAGGNTAVGNKSLINNTTGFANVSVGALSSNSLVSGSYNTVLGQAAYRYGTGSNNTAIGQSSLQNTTSSNNTAVGYQALKDNTTGANNVAVGGDALKFNTTGGSNLGLGYRAIQSNTTGSSNIAVGYQALNTNASGNFNVAVGKNSLLTNSAGSNNVAIGDSTLQNSTASSNTAVGKMALYANTSGTHNVAVGLSALDANTTASNNTAIGTYSLTTNTTGTNNTAVGEDSLFYNSTGSSNTAVGGGSLRNNTAANNTAVGHTAAYNNTTGTANSAFGQSALYTNRTGTRNNAFGSGALRYLNGGTGNAGFGNETFRSTTTGVHNIGVGDYAGYHNATGSGNIGIGYRSTFANTAGNYNVAVGYAALYNSAASGNVAVGKEALKNNSSGTRNTAIGENAGLSNTTGGNNVFLGGEAGRGRTTGALNVALGPLSLYATGGTSNSNIAIGYYCQFRNTTGGQNIAIGIQTMQDNTTGQDNLVLGHAAGGTGVGSHGNSNVALGYAAKTGNFNSSVILGRSATATANNQFVVGSSSNNAGAVTTETITADKTWTVKINGVDYKIPIVAA